eukprot:746179-Hanusia_phi.AAC.2
MTPLARSAVHLICYANAREMKRLLLLLSVRASSLCLTGSLLLLSSSVVILLLLRMIQRCSPADVWGGRHALNHKMSAAVERLNIFLPILALLRRFFLSYRRLDFLHPNCSDRRVSVLDRSQFHTLCPVVGAAAAVLGLVALRKLLLDPQHNVRVVHPPAEMAAARGVFAVGVAHYGDEEVDEEDGGEGDECDVNEPDVDVAAPCYFDLVLPDVSERDEEISDDIVEVGDWRVHHQRLLEAHADEGALVEGGILDEDVDGLGEAEEDEDVDEDPLEDVANEHLPDGHEQRADEVERKEHVQQPAPEDEHQPRHQPVLVPVDVGGVSDIVPSPHSPLSRHAQDGDGEETDGTREGADGGEVLVDEEDLFLEGQLQVLVRVEILAVDSSLGVGQPHKVWNTERPDDDVNGYEHLLLGPQDQGADRGVIV